MCCLASKSPRSIRFASVTSSEAVSSGCRPASRRKSWSASVVVSTGWTTGGGGGGGAASRAGSSSSTSTPRCSSSRKSASVSSASSSWSSTISAISACRIVPASVAASTVSWTPSRRRRLSISTVMRGTLYPRAATCQTRPKKGGPVGPPESADGETVPYVPASTGGGGGPSEQRRL